MDSLVAGVLAGLISDLISRLRRKRPSPPVVKEEETKRKVEQKRPERSAWVYVEKGFFYLEQGDFQQAIADFNRVLEINPDHAGAYIRRYHL